ncbi:MAG: FAD-dependent oxidoreductase [Chitinophagaceae bacterium]|nr:FAD-dependent oxidoreductase [Chitinophagaceae bacterium]
MQKIISIQLLPVEVADDAAIRQYLANSEGIDPLSISGYTIIKQSIDARGRQARVNLTVRAYIGEPFQERERMGFDFRDVSQSKHIVLIVGAGPAGLFAALKLIEAGIRPIILERGKDVRARRRDLALLNKEGTINPESNYCFGEGGAGTYSDDKLYTRSSKRGDIDRILHLFVHFGAEEKILYESHPHIGTNKLPQIITAMRERITENGGLFLFEKKVIDLIVSDGRISKVSTADGDHYSPDAVILATGHSARDIFELLHSRKLAIEAKSFALGVRVEHPQDLIDAAQYHLAPPKPASGVAVVRSPHLPPASYSLVEQVDGKGVFSFCMCPGGIIAPAATAPGELVVNGWSPSKRNNPYANSGIVVAVEEKDAAAYFGINTPVIDPFLLMRFQRDIEQRSYAAGGGEFVAPAQRLVDFTSSKLSASLPDCSYLPGLKSVMLKDALPGFINHKLQIAFKEFGKKIRGYHTNEAVVVATESRTSSPIRIPREKVGLHHPQASNLFPCGEGAGYAGGIVSAAMDGERVASRIATVLLRR